MGHPWSPRQAVLQEFMAVGMIKFYDFGLPIISFDRTIACFTQHLHDIFTPTKVLVSQNLYP